MNMRKEDVVKSKTASFSKVKRKFQRLRSKCGQYVDSFLKENLDTTGTPKCVYEKNISGISSSARVPLVTSKMELMKRFLLESAELNFLQARTPGDGIDGDVDGHTRLSVRTPGDGKDSYTNSDFDVISETGSGHELNHAFMSCDITSGEETVQQTRITLNDCVLYDSVDDISGDDEKESAFGDDSDCSSICDLERNIIELDVDDTMIKMERLKSTFSNGDLNARITEDKLLDSFMNTFVADSSNDEGLSSVDSDFE